MDELVQKSCEDAGLPPRDRQASSRMEPIRHSVRGYVDKYVTKGSGLPGKSLSDGWDALIPHQWWNRSDGLHRMLSGMIFHLPPAFVAFVLQQRRRLEGLRLGFGRVVQVGTRKTLCGDAANRGGFFPFLAAGALVNWPLSCFIGGLLIRRHGMRAEGHVFTWTSLRVTMVRLPSPSSG